MKQLHTCEQGPMFSVGRDKLKEVRGLIVRARRALLGTFLVLHVAFAQSSGAELQSTITDVQYPRLAEFARIHGDVHLKLAVGVVTVLSGHPLLAPTAVENAKSFRSIHGQTEIDLSY